jgi:hypothetical protein
LSPSLGVDQTWTKRTDHAPKSGCVEFLDVHPKKVRFGIFFL